MVFTLSSYLGKKGCCSSAYGYLLGDQRRRLVWKNNFLPKTKSGLAGQKTNLKQIVEERRKSGDI